MPEAAADTLQDRPKKAGAFRVRILSPERTLFEGAAASLSGRASNGDFQILPGHGRWVAPLEVCVVALETPEGKEERLAVHGGLIEAGPEEVLILADAAEKASGIDLERAREARTRAEERIKRPKEIDIERARRALARALARITALGEVSGT